MFRLVFLLNSKGLFMLKIHERYLNDFKIRDNSTTREEVLAGLFIDKFIAPNQTLIVGEYVSKNLPDIIVADKSFGWEVMRCEHYIDFLHKNATERLKEIDFDYNTYLKEKKDKNSIFYKVPLRITIDNGKITSTSIGGHFHSIDWMYGEYTVQLSKKLEKLNKGNYRNCEKCALFVLSLSRALDKSSVDVFQKALFTVSQYYEKLFCNVYLLKTSGIYEVKQSEIINTTLFKDDEYSMVVNEMKNILKIDQYS